MLVKKSCLQFQAYVSEPKCSCPNYFRFSTGTLLPQNPKIILIHFRQNYVLFTNVLVLGLINTNFHSFCSQVKTKNDYWFIQISFGPQWITYFGGSCTTFTSQYLFEDCAIGFCVWLTWIINHVIQV